MQNLQRPCERTRVHENFFYIVVSLISIVDYCLVGSGISQNHSLLKIDHGVPKFFLRDAMVSFRVLGRGHVAR